jgi:hypothetical protein
MKRSGSSPASEFDDFLLASIGDDNNGMQLSVLSALARLDVDPWEEAAALARLPCDAAIGKLTSLMAGLPAGPSARPDSGAIAGLISLLPRAVVSEVPSQPALPAIGAGTRSPVLTYLILYGIFMLFMFVFQWLAAGPHVPGVANSAPALPASSVSQHPTAAIVKPAP